jgi:hypothetical protein
MNTLQCTCMNHVSVSGVTFHLLIQHATHPLREFRFYAPARLGGGAGSLILLDVRAIVVLLVEL